GRVETGDGLRKANGKRLIDCGGRSALRLRKGDMGTAGLGRIQQLDRLLHCEGGELSFVVAEQPGTLIATPVIGPDQHIATREHRRIAANAGEVAKPRQLLDLPRGGVVNFWIGGGTVCLAGTSNDKQPAIRQNCRDLAGAWREIDLPKPSD